MSRVHLPRRVSSRSSVPPTQSVISPSTFLHPHQDVQIPIFLISFMWIFLEFWHFLQRLVSCPLNPIALPQSALQISTSTASLPTPSVGLALAHCSSSKWRACRQRPTRDSTPTATLLAQRRLEITVRLPCSFLTVIFVHWMRFSGTISSLGLGGGRSIAMKNQRAPSSVMPFGAKGLSFPVAQERRHMGASGTTYFWRLLFRLFPWTDFSGYTFLELTPNFVERELERGLGHFEDLGTLLSSVPFLLFLFLWIIISYLFIFILHLFIFI